jgi:hypothetical protein
MQFIALPSWFVIDTICRRNKMAPQEITDIPTEAEADEVVATFKSIGCYPVEKAPQSDGKWTVRVITCPGTRDSHSLQQRISAMPTPYFRTGIFG